MRDLYRQMVGGSPALVYQDGQVAQMTAEVGLLAAAAPARALRLLRARIEATPEIAAGIAALAIVQLALAASEAEDAGHLGEPENGYDESADREERLYDWPDGEVPNG